MSIILSRISLKRLGLANNKQTVPYLLFINILIQPLLKPNPLRTCLLTINVLIGCC